MSDDAYPVAGLILTGYGENTDAAGLVLDIYAVEESCILVIAGRIGCKGSLDHEAVACILGIGGCSHIPDGSDRVLAFPVDHIDLGTCGIGIAVLHDSRYVDLCDPGFTEGAFDLRFDTAACGNGAALSISSDYFGAPDRVNEGCNLCVRTFIVEKPRHKGGLLAGIDGCALGLDARDADGLCHACPHGSGHSQVSVFLCNTYEVISIGRFDLGSEHAARNFFFVAPGIGGLSSVCHKFYLGYRIGIIRIIQCDRHVKTAGDL